VTTRSHHIAVVIAGTALLALVSTVTAHGQERTSSLFRIAAHDDGSGAVERLNTGAAPTLPVARRVAVSAEVQAIDQVLSRNESRSAPLWIAVDAPASRTAIEPWRGAVRRLIERSGDALAVLEVRIDRQPVDLARFAMQLAATELRAKRDDEAFAALGGPAMRDETSRNAIYAAELVPYVDLLSVSDSGTADPLSAADEARLTAWLDRLDPAARLLLAGRIPAGQDAGAAILDALISDLGTTTVARVWSVSDLTAARTALASLAAFAGHSIITVDADAVALELRVGDRPASGDVQYRLLFDTETFSTLLFYWGSRADQPLSVSLRVPLSGTPAVVDLLSGGKSAAAGYTRNEAAERTQATVPLTGRPALINFNEGAEMIGERSGVSEPRRLSVDEIIARHQRQQLAQDRIVRHYIADAEVRHFFTPTLTDPGYDITATNRYYVAEDGIEWEQLSFAVNNRRFSGAPPTPMIQPEKVFAPPLQLRFDDNYTYRLEGTSTADGFECYEVRFEPTRDDASLYRGTVWIDRRTFARIKLRAVQGGLPGVVISNDETQHYSPVAVIGNRSVFLPTRLTARQIWLIAGRNIPLEKNVTFSGFRVNTDGFADERAAARASDRLMYRETSNGLRSYVKRGDERVVVDRMTESVKAIALGVVVDSSYRFPLPIAGINYVDFSFGNDQTQLAMLFAGVLAAGNIQRPQLLGSKRLGASLDFFAIAAPSSDRVYETGGEREAERLLTWPLSSGLNIGWQATAYQKLSLQYQLRFDGYARDTTTSESYQPPASTVTNGIGGAWEYSRSGYTAVFNAAWFARVGWKPWGGGLGEAPVETSPTYAKVTATLSRVFLIDAFQKVNVNAAWFGGRDLDRFVKYQFGLFDTTRIHGVPAAVRFGELALARGGYSVNVFDQYRLDLFLDLGWGRDARGDDWQRLPGIGGAFNLPGPWNTIVRADVGKSWLPERYDSLGSTTLQVMLLKPIR